MMFMSDECIILYILHVCTLCVYLIYHMACTGNMVVGDIINIFFVVNTQICVKNTDFCWD